jgi:type II secretory pathway component GspD/PulD (secretin)
LTVRRILALTTIAFALLFASSVYSADDEDTPKAAATRKKLQTKVTLKFKETSLSDAVDEIKDMTGVSFILDTKGGVSRNQKLNLDVKDVTLAEALDKMFEKNGLGYIVVSDKAKNAAYDGAILIKMGKERGSPIKDK